MSPYCPPCPPITPHDLVLKRRSQKSWNESDLDVAYEKKPPGSGGTNRVSEGRALSPWRESSLDGAGALGKDGCRGGHSSTLPRNYKVSPLSGERQGGGGSLRPPPRSWPPPPAPAPRFSHPGAPPAATPPAPPRHKPLPLSVIFKLQNAFWEQGGGVGGGNNPWGLLLGPPPQLQPPPQPQPPPQAGPRAPLKQLQLEGEGSPRPPPLSVSPPEPDPFLLLPAVPPFPEDSEEASRPLSPTRLQPLPPPEARAHPALGELLRVLAEVPRPLKRRGSQELRPTPRTRLYRHLIPRLLHPPAPAAAPPDAADAEPAAQSPGTAARGSPEAHAELRSALRDPSCPRRRPGGRVRLNPLVLLLDAALTGELDVVQQAVAELNDPSQPNAEGITALHNGICGANRPVVDFLIACGANVNAPDSHGWTPLHCAASCNDTGVCVALVRHGAAVFATTSSDGSVASEKCDPYREGYSECYSYLCEVEQGMGVLNSGVVYALWDFSAELQDELSFREGDAVTVLRRQPLDEHDWWWGSLYGHEGYVPRNYFGLFPRVRPQRKKT
ncbi:relA-associated inhibitor [Phaenicophaeus curvirostris]|uniref:relA-associated inhibitor n=1 Tax=Phaenicophaeus curvirostris TaxID=33595 RepID=UPI0037F0FD23